MIANRVCKGRYLVDDEITIGQTSDDGDWPFDVGEVLAGIALDQAP